MTTLSLKDGGAGKIAAALQGLTEVQTQLFGLANSNKSARADEILHTQACKDFVSKKSTGFRFALETKDAITSTGLINDPLVGSFTPDINAGPRRLLQVRELLPHAPTTNGAVEAPVLTSSVFGSPSVMRENATVAEASMSFDTSFAPVQTIATFQDATKQIFEDAGVLQAFIDQQLRYLLEKKIEDHLINGDGTGGALYGLLNGATAFATSPATTNDVDILRKAITAIQQSDYQPNAIILNPADFEAIQLRKAGASNDAYAAGAPSTESGNLLWGLPVLATNTIASGTYLVGDFNRAATVYVREAPMVEFSRSNDRNFTSNKVTALAQERLACVVSNADALRKGTFV